jgi:hypothetical protein|tara:strand:- start:1239 stop:1568 length:330 start_codon:yes stop_codon:yes gene_type:complete
LTVIQPFKGSTADLQTRQALQQAAAKLLESWQGLHAAIARLPNPRPFVRLVPKREATSTKTGVIFLHEGQERPPLHERDLTPFWQLDTWNSRTDRLKASGLIARKGSAA